MPLGILTLDALLGGFDRPEWSGAHEAFLRLARTPQALAGITPLLLWALASFAHALFTRERPGRWTQTGVGGGVVLASWFVLVNLGTIHASAHPIEVGLVGGPPFVVACLYLTVLVRIIGARAAQERLVVVRPRAAGHVRARTPADLDPRVIIRPRARSAPTVGSSEAVATEAPAARASRWPAWTPEGTWLLLAAGGTVAMVRAMDTLYAALPTEPPPPPGCWLATVAACGDPRIVGSTPVRFAGDQLRPVTRQLRTFKAFELALLALAPRAHRALRAVYDRVGPPLAARLGGRLAATITWLLLRPIELAARLTLRLLVRDADGLIERTYP